MSEELKAPFPYFGPEQRTLALQLAIYFVSNGVFSVDAEGRVWRHKDCGRPCDPRRAEHTDPKGYLRITMGVPGSRKTCHVQAHVLVWVLTNGPIPSELQVNHKDLNKQNNRPGNLELLTGAGNIQHSYANGRPHPWYKATVWRGKLRVTEVQKDTIRRLRRDGLSLKAIGGQFGLSITHVHRICAERKEVENG